MAVLKQYHLVATKKEYAEIKKIRKELIMDSGVSFYYSETGVL